MHLKFASYNIHKAVGTDGRRDPERILAVLGELDADVIALQEVDRRFGSRESVLPRVLVEERHWQVASLPMRPASMGWHGNAVLTRPGIEIVSVEPVTLPSIEPRGAVCVHLRHEGREFHVAGMHLDLSGLLRRKQIEAVCCHVHDIGMPGVLMGDLNEWSTARGALRGFEPNWNVLRPGRSFPSRRPMAALDRIAHSRHWSHVDTGVHHSPLAATASDHLPVVASLTLSA